MRRSLKTFQRWMNHNPKFKQCPENAAAMGSFMDVNKLDARKYKDYGKAFKALKKSGTVLLNK